MIKALFESWSRDQGHLRTVKIKGSNCMAPIWPLTHKNQAIKSFEWTIKHISCQSKILIPVANAQQATYKWLPLETLQQSTYQWLTSWMLMNILNSRKLVFPQNPTVLQRSQLFDSQINNQQIMTRPRSHTIVLSPHNLYRGPTKHWKWHTDMVRSRTYSLTYQPYCPSTWTIDRVKWTLNSGLVHTVSFPPLATRWVLAWFWHGSGMRRNPTCCSWGVSVSLELSQKFWKENLIVLKNRETVNALGTRQSWGPYESKNVDVSRNFSKCRFGEKSGVLLSS